MVTQKLSDCVCSSIPEPPVNSRLVCLSEEGEQGGPHPRSSPSLPGRYYLSPRTDKKMQV